MNDNNSYINIHQEQISSDIEEVSLEEALTLSHKIIDKNREAYEHLAE